VASCPVVYAIINAGTVSRKGSKEKWNIRNKDLLTVVVLERMIAEEELKENHPESKHVHFRVVGLLHSHDFGSHV